MIFVNGIRRLRARIRRPVFLWAITALAAELVARRALVGPRSSAARTTIALLPIVPAMLFVVALVRTVRAMDELQQRICLESAFNAFAMTIALSFALIGLDRVGVYHPRWDSLATPMLALWAGAYLFSVWKYR